MCIVSQPVKEVDSTKILVALSSDKTRQMIVYGNRVDNEIATNAMILPVPNPQTIKFHDLSKHKNIFKDLDSAFYHVTTNSFDGALSYSTNSMNMLKVFDVGSYQVSMANTVDDILRINKQVFDLSAGCYELLKSQYTSNFGFIVCKLKQGNATYHPLGYSHQVINQQKLFIPTKHYHEHTIDLQDSEYAVEQSEVNHDEKWQHMIYLYNCTGKQTQLHTIKSYDYSDLWKKNNPLLFDYNSIEFDFGHCTNLEKYSIKGDKPNIDLMVSA